MAMKGANKSVVKWRICGRGRRCDDACLCLSGKAQVGVTAVAIMDPVYHMSDTRVDIDEVGWYPTVDTMRRCVSPQRLESLGLCFGYLHSERIIKNNSHTVVRGGPAADQQSWGKVHLCKTTHNTHAQALQAKQRLSETSAITP
ncbi:hypothetical protein IG631_08372 [Alternaria alternata]|nr:hypothetical protein IG631_08372 [Alternaria alternata]